MHITALGGSIEYVATMRPRFDSFKEAIKVDPNFAAAYAQAANEMVFLGDAKAAIPLTERALELSPKDMSIHVFTWVQGRAYFAIGDYEKAADALGESVRERPNLWFSHAWLVAALALCDRDAEAKQALEGFKKGPFRDQTSVRSRNTTAKPNTKIPRWNGCG